MQIGPDEMETTLIRGCVREVLRLYPVAPFIGRFLDTDATLGGYNVPKHTMALISLFTSGRDADHFPDPLKFSPDRWHRSATHAGLENVLKTHGSLPFAIGSRSCVGKRIATYQMHCLITKLLQNFSMKSLNVEEVQFKLRMIGVMDRPIRIAFTKLS